MNLSKYKFKTRLIVGFGILIILNLISIIFSLEKVYDTRNDFEQMYEQSLLVSNLIRKINDKIDTVHNTLNNAEFYNDINKINSEIEIILKYNEAFNTVFKRFSGNFKDRERTLKTLHDLEIIRNEVIDIIEEEVKTKTTITKEKRHNQVHKILDRTGIMIDFAESTADKLYTEKINEKKRAVIILISLFVLIIAYSLFIAITIANSIEKPIKNITNRIQGIHNFNRNNAEEPTNLSEQEMLEISVKKLEFVSKELTQSEAKVRSLMDSIEDIVILIDRDCKILDLNIATTKNYNKTKNELLGRNVYDLISPNISNLRKFIIDEVFIKANSIRFEDKRFGKWYDNVISPIKDKEGNVQMCSILEKNISVHRNNERDLKEAKEVAEKANMAKSEFLANMSHELRTPLNAILGYAQMLKKDDNITQVQNQKLQTVYSSGNYLLSLINEILDFGKIEAGKTELIKSDFNLKYLINNLLNISKIKAYEKELYLRSELSNVLPEIVYGDEKIVSQILLNVINNAIKYTEKGGITLRVMYKKKERKVFVFEIEDTGIGISKKEIKEIFKPFTQIKTKQYVEGTGLGLPITEKLIKLIDGKLKLISIPNIGTKFSIEIPLPVVDDVIECKPFKRTEIIGYEGKRKQVLVVDDNQPNLLMISHLMESLGFHTHIAETLNNAVSNINKCIPDLILLDFIMPEVNGYELAIKLKKQFNFKHTKIIGISATSDKYSEVIEFKNICDGFLSKPISHNLLFEMIKEQLELKWIFRENVKLPIVNDFNERIPSSDVLKKIMRLCKYGDFVSLEELVERLRNQYVSYSNFCDRISKHMQTYDDDSILEYIKKLQNLNLHEN